MGRHQSPCLHGVAGMAVHPQHLLAGVLGLAERPVHVAQLDMVAAGHVGALLLVDDDVAAQGRLDIGHHFERLVLHLDQVRPVLRHVTVHRRHQRHRLTHIRDLAPGQRILEEPVQSIQLVHAQRDRLDARGQIGKGEHADDPRELQCLRHVHRLDAGVRVRAPQDGRAKHPGQLHIVDERGLAGQEPNGLHRAGSAPRCKSASCPAPRVHFTIGPQKDTTLVFRFHITMIHRGSSFQRPPTPSPSGERVGVRVPGPSSPLTTARNGRGKGYCGALTRPSATLSQRERGLSCL